MWRYSSIVWELSAVYVLCVVRLLERKIMPFCSLWDVLNVHIRVQSYWLVPNCICKKCDVFNVTWRNYFGQFTAYFTGSLLTLNLFQLSFYEPDAVVTNTLWRVKSITGLLASTDRRLLPSKPGFVVEEGECAVAFLSTVSSLVEVGCPVRAFEEWVPGLQAPGGCAPVDGCGYIRHTIFNSPIALVLWLKIAICFLCICNGVSKQ